MRELRWILRRWFSRGPSLKERLAPYSYHPRDPGKPNRYGT